MDLKIAAIAIVNNAIVLTRNNSDFGQIANLILSIHCAIFWVEGAIAITVSCVFRQSLFSY